LGTKDTEVRVELHDVIISLGFDRSSKKSSHDTYPDKNNKNNKKLNYDNITEIHNLQESHKQHLIREVQLWLDGTIKDFPKELQKNKIINDKDVLRKINSPKEKESTIKSVATLTSMERFWRFLASSIGWRIARGCIATFQNIQILLSNKNIEMGFTNKIFHVDNILESFSFISLEESPSFFQDKKLTKKEEKTNKIVKITGLGVFLRSKNFSSSKKRTHKKTNDVSLEDYILHPFNVEAKLNISRYCDSRFW
jgi:hypothetical protein